MAMIAVLYKQGGEKTWNDEITKGQPSLEELLSGGKRFEVEKEGFELSEPS
jgi:hypothetical protein